MRTFLLTAIGCFAFIISSAQLKIMDLNVLPISQGETLSNDSIQLLIQFKISNPALSQNIHFQFGTQPNIGDVLNEVAPVMLQGSEYIVTYNGRQEIIRNHDVRIYCKMSMANYNAWQNLTVFAVSTTGNNSENLYQTR